MEPFDQHHLDLIGPRWWDLKQALQAEEVKFALENPFYPSGQLSSHYLLDPASVWPAHALEVQPGERVADFCAAPGGKSLALLFDLQRRLSPTKADFKIELHLSDQSLARIKRLKTVLRSYLPESLLSQIQVWHRDASRWGLHQSSHFDRILLDAPCSGERHLLENQGELKKWSKARSKHLQNRQMALLCSALEVLKPGGRLVYSTCSVSPLENDQLVKRFLKKRRNRVLVLDSFPQPDFAEKTEFGYQIWPDLPPFAGPIYYCALTKAPDDSTAP